MSQKLRLTCPECGQANQFPADRAASAPKCGICGHALVDGKVAPVDFRTLEKMAKTDGLPLLVDFWAPWCAPCRGMAPAFAAAAARLEPDLRLAKLDTEAHPTIAGRFAIRSIPTLILFRDGREIARQAGAMDTASIEAWVKARLGS